MQTDSPSSLARLRRVLIGDPTFRRRISIAVACLVASKGAALAVPYFYKLVVDEVADTDASATDGVLLAILGYGLVRIAGLALDQVRERFVAKVGQRAARVLSKQVFSHLLSLSMDYHANREIGALSRCIERGSDALVRLINFLLFNLLPTLAEITVVSAILWWMFGWQLGVLVALSAAAFLAFTAVTAGYRTRAHRQLIHRNNTVSNIALDSLLNIWSVKDYTNEDIEVARFDTALQERENAALKNQLILGLLASGQTLLVVGAMTAALAITATRVRDTDMSIGDFVLVHTYLLQVFQPLNFVGLILREIRRDLIDTDHMLEVLNVAPTLRESPGAVELSVSKGIIDVKDVSFAYDGSRPALREVSFQIAGGSTTAIVGASGSGKSTFGRLLIRLHDPSSGSIEIDGQDIRHVTLKSLRECVTIVPQETVLFNDTLWNNVSYGRRDCTEEELRQAANLAHLDELMERLPDGGDTVLGERGNRISGGERQRVGLARLFLERPQIVVLDEATSGVDVPTSAEIREALSRILDEPTVIVITHRLETVTDADQIIVVEAGRVAGIGTHEALFESNDSYRALWKPGAR